MIEQIFKNKIKDLDISIFSWASMKSKQTFNNTEAIILKRSVYSEMISMVEILENTLKQKQLQEESEKAGEKLVEDLEK